MLKLALSPRLMLPTAKLNPGTTASASPNLNSSGFAAFHDELT